MIHDIDLNHFRDGAIYVSGPVQYQDLLQILFDSLYESDGLVKMTLQQSHAYLGNLRVLVILDDSGLGPKQIDPVLDALAEAAVVIVGPERTAVGRGRALRLKGLPHQDAVTLFKQSLGRALSSDEPLILDQICTLLNDMPLPISGVAAQAAQTNLSLKKLLTDLQGRKPWAGQGADLSVGPSLEQIVLALDATDRQLITLLAAFDESSASCEALQALIDLSGRDFDEHIESLRALGLVQFERPTKRSRTSGLGGEIPARVALASAFHQTARTWLVDDSARSSIAAYYATRLGQGDRLPVDELPNLLGAIEDCVRSGWLDQLKPMVRAADQSLARLRWWNEWQHVLDLTRRAAQADADRGLEAWAMHQLGTVLGALSTFDRAMHLLRTALSIRQALGDQTGAALTQQNLEVLEYMVPARVEEETAQPQDQTESQEQMDEPEPTIETQDAVSAGPPSTDRSKRIRLGLAFAAVSALILVGLLVLRFVAGVGESTGQDLDLNISWEFGDAWNAIDSESWTQQLKIVTDGSDGDLSYFLNGEPVSEMFEVVLPLCEGAHGTIRVESDVGASAEVDFAFDSPFCR